MKRLLALLVFAPLLSQAASTIALPGTGGGAGGSATNVAAADITDATMVGVDLMTAADEDAAWLTLGGDTRVSNVVYTITNYVSLYVTNLTAEEFLVGTNDIVAELAAKASLASPTFTGSFSLTQTELQPHDSVTNFVMDPTAGAVQLINATNWVVRFLHATNIAAGRQTSFLVLAGTNATVSVEIPTSGLEWTNKVSIAAGQALQVALYGYGSNNTNTLVTFGRMLQ